MNRTILILSVALTVSVAGNALIGGWIAGNAYRGRPGPMMGGGDFAPARMAEALPPEHRGAFRNSFESRRPELQARTTEARQARLAVRRIMLQDPFDSAAAATALHEMRSRNLAAQETMHAASIEAFAKLPPEVRRRLADAPFMGGMREERRERREDRR